jgi:hypothetical protein
MNAVAIALAVGAVALTPSAAGRPTAAKDRVAITAKGGIHGFVLAPATTGMVQPDSGTVANCCWTHRVVTRDGQRVEIDDPLTILTGKRGAIHMRFRIEWVDAGNGYVVGTGTWKVVAGTGAYAHVTGSGRSAHAWLPSGPTSFRAEGFLGVS